MKDFLTGGIFGLPTSAILLILALFLVCGLQQLGVDPTVYKSVAGASVIACLSLGVYSYFKSKNG